MPRLQGSVWGSIIKDGRDLDEKGLMIMDSFRNLLGDGKEILFWEDRSTPLGR